jgi:hypothetical protein
MANYPWSRQSFRILRSERAQIKGKPVQTTTSLSEEGARRLHQAARRTAFEGHNAGIEGQKSSALSTMRSILAFGISMMMGVWSGRGKSTIHLQTDDQVNIFTHRPRVFRLQPNPSLRKRQQVADTRRHPIMIVSLRLKHGSGVTSQFVTRAILQACSGVFRNFVLKLTQCYKCCPVKQNKGETMCAGRKPSVYVLLYVSSSTISDSLSHLARCRGAVPQLS